MVDLAATVFRDFVTDGVPSSGLNKPHKKDIRAWGAYLESLYAAAQAGGGVVFQNVAAMTLGYSANQIAWVVADTTAANNGIYQKQGAADAGSWTRVADLPYSFARMTDAGAGTANAIQVTSTIPTSVAVLRVANIYRDNTGAVTVAENGNTAKALKTASGNNLAAGGLLAGMMVLYLDTGTEYRLVTDYASASIVTAAEAAQAAAEAAQAAAEAAAAGVDLPSITTGDAGKTLIVKATEDGYELGEGGVADDTVTDAKVKSDAAIKASKLAYSLDETNPTDYPFRAVYQRLREKISVVDTGGKGTGAADDDTAAFQEAISYANTKRLREVYVPSHAPGAYWQISEPLVLNKPIKIRGEHILNTIAQKTGFSAGQYLIDVDGVTLGEDLEQVVLENLTIRPYLNVGTRVNGIKLNRVANPILRNVIVYAPSEGIRVTGNRLYHSLFENVQIYGAAADGFIVVSFTGGGQHNFRGCQFTSCTTGFRENGDSTISAVNFFGCAWEGCTQAFEVVGDIRGMNMWGCYSESNGASGGSTFRFIPDSGKAQRGIVVKGGFFHTDNEAYTFLMGGTGGVSGIDVSNNQTMNYGTALIRNNSNFGYGDVRNNFLTATTAVISNGPVSTLTLSGNHGNSGALSS